MVLAPRPWRLSRPACAGRATGAKEAVPRGEHEVSRQTIARGRPGCPGCTCQTRVRFLLPIAHGAAGAAGARPSLRPLSRGSKRVRKTQAIPRRENESAYLSPSLRGAKRRPVYACCASYAGLGVRRSSESEGGSNPALLRSPAKSAKFSCRPVQASEASAIRDP